jgi:ribonuclease-3
MSKKDDTNINVEKISKLIGYDFKNTKLLTESFTHKSVSENNYERLEFLGDAVLQLIITKNLYKTYPHIDEGTLSR